MQLGGVEQTKERYRDVRGIGFLSGLMQDFRYAARGLGKSPGFLRVLDVDLGFKPSQAAVVDINYDTGPKGEKIAPSLQQILTAVRAVPGVEAAGVADRLPLDRDRNWGLLNPSREYGKKEAFGAIVRIVTPGYLEAMGIRLIEGRDITWQEVFTGLGGHH